MKTSKAAVLFIDMLGFSALTQGKIALGIDVCSAWKIEPLGDFPHQQLAAKLLLSFRKILSSVQNEFKDVRVAQLSDCAFLWSPNIESVADAAHVLMHEAATSGLLCRGGLAYGSVQEPSKVNWDLGPFILGDAVTRAATFETTGKGMRIFTDSETMLQFSSTKDERNFQELLNPLTQELFWEWQWYKPKFSHFNVQHFNQYIQSLDRLTTSYAMLSCSPKYAWNCSTAEGRKQIECSTVGLLNVLSENFAKTFKVDSSSEINERSNQAKATLEKKLRIEIARNINMPGIPPSQ